MTNWHEMQQYTDPDTAPCIHGTPAGERCCECELEVAQAEAQEFDAACQEFFDALKVLETDECPTGPVPEHIRAYIRERFGGFVDE